MTNRNRGSDSLCRHFKTLVVERYLELDFVARDFAGISKCSERPLGRKRDFVAIYFAVLNRRFVLGARHGASQFSGIDLEGERVDALRPIRRVEFRLPLPADIRGHGSDAQQHGKTPDRPDQTTFHWLL